MKFMEPYKNLSGDSGVAKYKIFSDAIAIQFEDHGVYLYDYSKPGSEHVERMKALAAAGKGLCTYINRFVGKNFAARLR